MNGTFRARDTAAINLFRLQLHRQMRNVSFVAYLLDFTIRQLIIFSGCVDAQDEVSMRDGPNVQVVNIGNSLNS